MHEIDGPLNVVMGLGSSKLTVAEVTGVGVTRISLGGSIARAALGFVRRAAEELQTHGTMSFAEGQIPQGELNQLFARYAARYGRRGTGHANTRAVREDCPGVRRTG